MISILYELFQYLIFLCALPKFIWQRLIKGKFKNCFPYYLTIYLPRVLPRKGKVFLIYAVSMGETKAAAALFKTLKERYSGDQFYVVSRTSTGLAEARKSLPLADGHFFLPLDFSWTMNRFLKRVRPDFVVVVESDFWLNFLKKSKRMGALVFLVSGKISARSFQRFKFFSFFAKELFASFDLICTQNNLFKERFEKLGVLSERIKVTGNLKFDTPFTKMDRSGIRDKLGILSSDTVLVIASTHSGEESAILDAIEPLWSSIHSLKVVLVPRHPERFSEVENLLKRKGLSTITYTQIDKKNGSEKVVLIDVMGHLLSVYQVADLAIVGGSFFKHLKGHNIFEPIQARVPVLFGPYMSDQRDLVEGILSFQAGKQVSLETLALTAQELLKNQNLAEEMRRSGDDFSLLMKGCSERTTLVISEKIEKLERKD